MCFRLFIGPMILILILTLITRYSNPETTGSVATYLMLCTLPFVKVYFCWRHEMESPPGSETTKKTNGTVHPSFRFILPDPPRCLSVRNLPPLEVQSVDLPILVAHAGWGMKCHPRR